ncbi:MAG: deoxyguanosinetriphosphate triphosphohydrolase [Finegoldia sp.]|nr:deoxyguanosinetriphosphate triphosphohydrolase [Finegoldia sp.]
MTVFYNNSKKYDDLLSEYAVKSTDATRKEKEEDDPIRNPFQLDRDRIIHSKSFRRLKRKTQVYISPEKDHYRTRLTHTLEVTQIARTIARALNLNEDLAEAIGLAHDLGHTPFGHLGEKVLNELNPKGFKHYEQSVNVVTYLENSRKRQGLNLTDQTIDGIAHHSGENISKTLEGRLIKFSDRIAYINHDIDDSIRAKIISEDDLPDYITSKLGHRGSERINYLVTDLISNSYGKNEIKMSDETYKLMDDLRNYMFENVYYNPVVRQDDEKVEYILESLYTYYKKDLARLPQSHLTIYKNKSLQDKTDDDIVTDYIAGMTDSFARSIYLDIFIPKSWQI